MPRSSVGPAPRLAVAYVALFGWMGVYLPYWPVWLAERGMSPAQVGVLLAMTSWTRVLANPLAGHWADRSGRPHHLVQRLSLLLVITLFSFTFVEGFASLLVAMIGAGLTFGPIIPLIDGLTISADAEGRLRYGPVRMWGSAAFILTSWIGGELLERQGEPIVLWMLMALAGMIAAASLLVPAGASYTKPLPSDPAAPEPHESPGSVPAPSGSPEPHEPPGSVPAPSGPPEPPHPPQPPPSPWSRHFVGVLAMASLLHAAHAVLYGFGTQHWRTHGLDEGTVGLLWAEGVIAEIILFALAPRFDRWLSPRGLWLLAGSAGVLRWGLLASTVAIPWLVVGQVLHALTYGALHLGVMATIRRHVAPGARGRATTSYAAIATGLALGLALPLAGVLYEHLAGDAYWVMSGLAFAGLLLARWLGDPGSPEPA